LLKAFSLTDRKALVVLAKDENVLLSARNIQGARVVHASEVNTYDIMNAHQRVDREGSDRPVGSHPYQVSHEQILIRPLITEKMTAQTEKEGPLRLRGGPREQQGGDQATP
jgi:hypothetical protein